MPLSTRREFVILNMSKKAELLTGYFPNIYLSVTSLLQGIALSQLVAIILKYLEIIPKPWGNTQVLPLLLMLLVIFIVWHHYAIGIFYLRWFPNIIDTLVPFLVGIGQFVLISYINIETNLTEIQIIPWTYGYAIFLIIGSLAYFSASWRLDPDLFINVMSKEASLKHAELTKKHFTLSGCSILGQGIFAFLIALTQTDILLIGSILLLVIHLVLFEFALMNSIKPHYIKAMDEFQEALDKQ